MSESLVAQIYTEEALIAALKARDNKAYEYLYFKYREALFTVIYQFNFEGAIAEDLLQEVFIVIWKNIDKYDATKGRFYTWMHILTRNTCINALRAKNFKVHHQNENLTDAVYSNEVNNSIEQNIGLIGLRKQVHSLKADYKHVIELFYFKGFTQEEAANILGIPIGTVKTRLRHALIELRKHFTL